MSQSLSEAIKSADLVIIGIGKEWNWVRNGVINDPRYTKIIDYCNKVDNKWLLPIVEYEYSIFNSNKRIEDAYVALRKLIGDKKYFLVSDIVLHDALNYGFDDEKSVYPCGNMNYLQTAVSEDGLFDIRDADSFQSLVKEIHSIIKDSDGEFDTDRVFNKPEIDGKELYLNQKRSDYNQVSYNESSYIDKWNIYLQFLSRSLNSNLLLLELGVGLDFPTVIRWPFEKVTFINKKAHLIRANEKLFHHTPEIKDKTESVEMNSVDFVLQESKGL